MLLEGRNAVIYGGGGSIGGAVARAFAREGATVHLAGRTQAKLDAPPRTIRAAGGRAETAVVDALDERRWTHTPMRSPPSHGSLDISMASSPGRTRRSRTRSARAAWRCTNGRSRSSVPRGPRPGGRRGERRARGRRRAIASVRRAIMGRRMFSGGSGPWTAIRGQRLGGGDRRSSTVSSPPGGRAARARRPSFTFGTHGIRVVTLQTNGIAGDVGPGFRAKIEADIGRQHDASARARRRSASVGRSQPGLARVRGTSAARSTRRRSDIRYRAVRRCSSGLGNRDSCASRSPAGSTRAPTNLARNCR